VRLSRESAFLLEATANRIAALESRNRRLERELSNHQIMERAFCGDEPAENKTTLNIRDILKDKKREKNK